VIATKRVSGASAAVEDYIKAIYQVADETGGVVTTTGLATRLDVTAPSVSAMLKRLDAMGLVAHAP
jgi:DtxR family Mn-dependent transcriptional regulator